MNHAVSINDNSIKKKYFIVFICMFMQAIPFGVAQNIQPLFIPYVINNFGFSLAGFSLIFTFGAMASAAFSPFLGKLFGKVNIKVLFIHSILLYLSSFIKQVKSYIGLNLRAFDKMYNILNTAML